MENEESRQPIDERADAERPMAAGQRGPQIDFEKICNLLEALQAKTKPGTGVKIIKVGDENINICTRWIGRTPLD